MKQNETEWNGMQMNELIVREISVFRLFKLRHVSRYLDIGRKENDLELPVSLGDIFEVYNELEISFQEILS